MIRPAQVCDLDDVLRISRAGFLAREDRFGAGWLVSVLALPGTRLWVESPGVGVIRGYLLTESYQTGTLARLVAVDPDYQRQGVGRRLLAMVAAPGSAWVRTENVASRGLFTAAGWEMANDPPKRRRAGSWVYFVRE